MLAAQGQNGKTGRAGDTTPNRSTSSNNKSEETSDEIAMKLEMKLEMKI